MTIIAQNMENMIHFLYFQCIFLHWQLFALLKGALSKTAWEVFNSASIDVLMFDVYI